MNRKTIALFLLLGLLWSGSGAMVLAAPPPQAEGEAYIVQADDWLSKLAEKFYGDIFAYPAIVAATNAKAAADDSYAVITNPDLIEIGQKLFIPQAEAAIALLAGAGPSVGRTFPLTIDNCGLATTYAAPPARAVTMNQSATEIMLALGLADKMAGTAYLDDEILPELAEAYHSLPVLAEEYPSPEVLLAAEPDFVYGAYRSAFAEEAAGPRPRLQELGINAYLSVSSCEDEALRPTAATMETVFAEIRDIATIFGVAERGEALIAEMQAQLANVTATIGADREPVKIFWFDSEDGGSPLAGACCGIPNEIIRQVGGENIFSDVAGSWATVSWEEVIDRDPAAIVVIDAEWSPALATIARLTGDPAYASIKAVQAERFVIVPFSATTLGIRNVAAVEMVAAGLYPDRFK
jgi:iron complex transport system substrate-binding protein